MIVVEIGELSEQCAKLLDKLDTKYEFLHLYMHDMEKHVQSFSHNRLLFALHLKEFGVNIQIESLIEKLAILHRENPNLFEGSIGGVFISSEEEDYTKQVASTLVYRLNKMGLRFVGRPIVEAPANLQNFLGQSERSKKTLEESLEWELSAMLARMNALFASRKKVLRGDLKKKIVALHSSNEYSNTLALWKMVKKELDSHYIIEEIAIKNGDISDCRACGYKACKTFGMSDSCYYEGKMVDEIYPAISETDILLLICPNYNDALSANMTAMINRMTALFRKQKFYDKMLYAIIVSGSSGNEVLASQLIRALSMNKTFQLPPGFSLSAIANARGAIYQVPGIEQKAKLFAEKIITHNL